MACNLKQIAESVTIRRYPSNDLYYQTLPSEQVVLRGRFAVELVVNTQFLDSLC